MITHFFPYIVVCLLLCAAPATSQTHPRGPADEGGAGPSDARIRPGDQISLRIFREPELSGEFNVSENGSVVLPRLGAVAVVDFSADVLQDSLRNAYARFLRNPAVEVTILRRIAVHGEVRRPDVYMVDLTVTVREVIARAGGLTEAGNVRKIMIVREGERIPVPPDAGAGLSVSAAELRSGDQIVVGRRSWMAMNPLAVISTGMALVSFTVGVIVPLIR